MSLIAPTIIFGCQKEERGFLSKLASAFQASFQSSAIYEEQNPFIYCGAKRNNYSQANVGNREKAANECPFCYHVATDHPSIMKKFDNSFLKLNDSPYTPGTSLFLPNAHIPALKDMTKEEQITFISCLLQSTKAIKTGLSDITEVHIGLNLGREAGASQPSHMHFHIVPIGDNALTHTISSDTKTPDNEEIHKKLSPKMAAITSDQPISKTNSEHTHKKDCPSCALFNSTDHDKTNLIIARTEHGIVKLHDHPSHNGHVIYIPKNHHTSLSESQLSKEELADITDFFTKMPQVYEELFKTDVGGVSLNFHIKEEINDKLTTNGAHTYISSIPRKTGDSAFLTILAGYPLITRNTETLYDNFKKRWDNSQSN